MILAGGRPPAETRAARIERMFPGLLTEVLALHPGVTVADIFGRAHPRYIAEARHHLVYELYDRVRSYRVVGDLVGRDHTTCMASRERWAAIVGDSKPETVRYAWEAAE